MGFEHRSVLLDETIAYLNIKPDGVYADGTLGGGGHAYEVCRRLSEKGRYIGVDQDAAAIEAAKKRLLPFGDRVAIVRSNYEAMDRVLSDLGSGRWTGSFWIWAYPPISSTTRTEASPICTTQGSI